jgi:hypothetical protein
MGFRTISDKEKQFIVEKWARNPNAAHVRRKWQFLTTKPSISGIHSIIAK